jgi:hypothetical protein
MAADLTVQIREPLDETADSRLPRRARSCGVIESAVVQPAEDLGVRAQVEAGQVEEGDRLAAPPGKIGAHSADVGDTPTTDRRVADVGRTSADHDGGATPRSAESAASPSPVFSR